MALLLIHPEHLGGEMPHSPLQGLNITEMLGAVSQQEGK